MSHNEKNLLAVKNKSTRSAFINVGLVSLFRSSCPEVFCKKGAFKNFAHSTRKHPCQSLVIKKETVAQVLSCEFWRKLKKTPLSKYFKKIFPIQVTIPR